MNATATRARPLRAVLLDAGNTLFFERPSRFDVYAAAARDLGLGVEPEAVREAMHAEHERLPRVDGEPVRYTDRWFRAYVPAVFRSLGAPEPTLPGLTDVVLARFRAEALFHLYPETIPTLERLRALGLRLAVVSNWSPRLLGHLERLGVAQLLDAAVVSAVEGIEKPSPGIFECALEKLGVAPDESMHVGDHVVKDVEGARAAGVRAVLIDRAGQGAPAGVETISSLAELPRLVGANG
ncbi:MAG TPA: HAD-IA family hydrolase [Planctomycetota bacterium]|nr:HAD-IA family hydrolase [Planctomycetota bacterium]